MKRYFFYNKTDKTCEPISKVWAMNRLEAAKMFSLSKRLTLRQFLTIYAVSK